MIFEAVPAENLQPPIGTWHVIGSQFGNVVCWHGFASHVEALRTWAGLWRHADRLPPDSPTAT